MKNNIVIRNDEHGNIATSLQYISNFNFDKNSKILDIGCGYGSLIYNLKRNGYNNVYGIDVNNYKILAGKIDYPEIADNLKFYAGEKLPYKDNYFDVILMFDVIEHIPDIILFFQKQVHRVLKQGGLLIFQTPNKIINIPWEVINCKSLFKWRKYHCSLQTDKSLDMLLRNTGFSNILIEKNNIITDHNKCKVYEKLSYLGLLMLYVLQRMPLRLYPNLWGSAKKC